MLGEAAGTIAGAVFRLRPDADRVALLHRGADELWSRTVNLLSGRGVTVTVVELDEHDQTWRMPDPLGAALLSIENSIVAADVLVHHDPFVGGGERSGLDSLHQLTAGGTAAVFVSFPHGLAPAVRSQARRVFLQALAADEEQQLSLARRLSGSLEAMRYITVTGPDDEMLRAYPPLTVRCDWTSAAVDAPILQLPYGEVWVVCEPANVEGSMAMARGARGTVTADVDAGQLRWRRGGIGRWPREPLVEIGLGVNPDALWLPQVMLHEKSLGRLHVGFGDSSLIGGHHAAADHFDLPLHPGSAIQGLERLLSQW